MRASLLALALAALLVPSARAEHPASLVLTKDVGDRELSDALGAIDKLRFLTAREARISYKPFVKHADRLQHLERASFTNCRITDKLIIALGKATSLRSLKLRDCSRITGRAIGRLRALSGLAELDLVGTRVDGRALQQLEQYGLETLRVGGERWRERDLERVVKLTRLTGLELWTNAIGDGAVLARLPASLRRLTLGGGLIGPAAFAKLAKLEQLHVMGEARLTAEAAAALPTLGELRQLTLTGVDKAFVEALELPRQVHTVAIRDSPELDDAALAVLMSKLGRGVEHLDLRGTGATGAGLTKQAATARQLERLTITRPLSRGLDLSAFPKLKTFVLAADRDEVPLPEEQLGTMVDFTDTHTLDCPTGTTKARLLTILPHSLPRRQRIDRIVFSPPPRRIVRDGASDHAEFVFERPARAEVVEVTVRAELYRYDLSAARSYREVDAELSDAERERYLATTATLPAKDPQVVELAAISKAKTAYALASDLQQLVVDRLEYRPQAGAAPPAKALASGHGDCSEYADLLAALCRARQVPARVVTGALLHPKAQIRHAWVEVWAKTAGWVPFDPTYGEEESAEADTLTLFRLYEQLDRDDELVGGLQTVRYWAWDGKAKHSEKLAYAPVMID